MNVSVRRFSLQIDLLHNESGIGENGEPLPKGQHSTAQNVLRELNKRRDEDSQ